MSDNAERRQNTLFTYGLGLAFGLPLASAVATPLSRSLPEAAQMGVLLALTLVLGAAGAALGYLVDRARQTRGRRG